ncbi:MAG: zinc-binding dehydrogenase [Caldilineaceae bacterium]|nr:zinc-binding dehydrogenase [Caldilineaceae bacterium]
MKALVLTGLRQIELQELPIPSPGPGQVLVRHEVTAISTGSEVIRYVAGAGPAIGYLGAGVVEAIGPGVEQLQPGDRVRTTGPHHEYVLTSVDAALKIPDRVDFAQAAFAYLPTLVLHALRLCDYRLGETLCVLGQGVVGLMGSALAAAQGIPLLALDTEETRLDIARQMGIPHALDPLAPDFPASLSSLVGDRGIDVTVDATGSYRGLVQAMELTRKWGRVAILGIYRPDPPDPAMAAAIHQAYLQNFHSKELRLVGCSNDPAERYPSHIWRFSIHDNTRQSLHLLGQGRLNLAPAITHRFVPEDGPALYARLGQREAGLLGAVYEWG